MNSHCNKHYRKTISKRPKIELSKEELKGHVSKGTLGKFSAYAEGSLQEYGLKGGMRKWDCWARSPSTSRTNQRLYTQPPFHTVAGLPSFALKLKNVSPEPGRVCLTEAGLYIYETLCCRGDSIACTAPHPRLCCVLSYCLKKEPQFCTIKKCS